MLLVGGDSCVKVGSPYVDGVTVKAHVEDHIRGEKVVGFKYKKRKNYRRNWGHRPEYTLLKVEDIAGV